MLILSIFVLLYGISFYFSEKLSETVGIPHIITVFATTLFLLFFLFFLARKKKLKKYGVSFPIDLKKAPVSIAALLIIPIINICFYGDGIAENQALISAFMVFATAFSEELLFRGILPSKIAESFGISKKTGTVLSNAVFAALHICSLPSADWLIMRLFAVFAVGLCLSALRDRTHSIFPGFIIHFLINISYSDRAFESFTYRSMWIILVILYLIYDIWYLTKEEIK